MSCRNSFSRLTLCIFVTAFLMATGCSDDDNGNGPTGTLEVLDATYALQEVRVTGEGVDITLSPPAATGTAVVTSDSRFATNISIPSQGFEGSWSGTYSVSGNTLTLNFDDGSVEQWTISSDRNRIAGAATSGGFTAVQTYMRI